MGAIRQSEIPRKYGVYIIEIPELYTNPPLNEAAISNWLGISKKVEIDEKKVDLKTVKKQLSTFWKPNESIVYIGQSSLSQKGINKRLSDFLVISRGKKVHMQVVIG